MPQYNTYIEIPVIVDYDWTEDGPEITSIEIGEDSNLSRPAFIKGAKSFPCLNLQNVLTDRELNCIKEEI